MFALVLSHCMSHSRLNTNTMTQAGCKHMAHCINLSMLMRYTLSYRGWQGIWDCQKRIPIPGCKLYDSLSPQGFWIIDGYIHIFMYIIALQRFRGREDVSLDIDEMLIEQEQHQQEPEWTFMMLLKSKELRLPLILVSCLAMSQQLSGINVVRIWITRVVTWSYKW